MSSLIINGHANSLIDKVANAIVITLTYYFLTNLRREPSAYFYFLLINFSLTLTMVRMFRTPGILSLITTHAVDVLPVRG